MPLFKVPLALRVTEEVAAANMGEAIRKAQSKAAWDHFNDDKDWKVDGDVMIIPSDQQQERSTL